MIKTHVLQYCFFIYGCAGSLLPRGLFPHGRQQGLVSSCGTQVSLVVVPLVVEPGLQSTWLQQLWHVGSVIVAPELQSTGLTVVVHRLSCPVACGIFADQGQNPRLLYWQVESLPLSHQGNPHFFFVTVCHVRLKMKSFHTIYLKLPGKQAVHIQCYCRIIRECS